MWNLEYKPEPEYFQTRLRIEFKTNCHTFNFFSLATTYRLIHACFLTLETVFLCTEPVLYSVEKTVSQTEKFVYIVHAISCLHRDIRGFQPELLSCTVGSKGSIYTYIYCFNFFLNPEFFAQSDLSHLNLDAHDANFPVLILTFEIIWMGAV